MATIDDLTYTNNMAANKKPFLTDLVETLDSIQTHMNDKIGDNLEQLLLDAFPSGYAVDDDGAKNFGTHNLYDKQTASDTYTGGDITISTTGAWTDVDATNAALVFTPDYLAGDFRLVFQFCVESVTSNAGNETDIRFRLTDSSTASDALAKLHLVTGVITTTNTHQFTLEHQYDALAASAQTIKLQYYITTQSNTTIKVKASTNTPIVMTAEKV